MAYTKTNWVDDATFINASNMNNIENGIVGNETSIGTLGSRVTTVEGGVSTNATDIATNATAIGTNTTAIGNLQGSVSGKENSLGNPSLDGYVLTSTSAGVRTWVAQSSGASTILELTDTPSSYLGQAGKRLTIKADETGVEFAESSGTGTTSAKYKFNTSTSGDPTSGKVAINSADGDLATIVRISHTDNDGTNRSYGIGSIGKGDWLSLGDTNSSNNYTYIVSGDPVDNGAYSDIPVNFNNSRSTFGNNERITVEVVYIGAKLFTDLNDTPNDFATSANKLVAVNGSANSLIFIPNDKQTDLGFGSAGQILATNGSANGTEWITNTGGGSGGQVDSVVGGLNCTVDSTDPINPIINVADMSYDDSTIQAEVTLNTAKVSNIAHPLVETAVPTGAVFTDTVYDDTAIQAEVTLNTAKVSNIAHPLVETAVPTGAVFTDTVYNDTAIQAEVTLNTAKVGITTAQASAITANTAKTGITTAQASAITDNTTAIGTKQDDLGFGTVGQVLATKLGATDTEWVTISGGGTDLSQTVSSTSIELVSSSGNNTVMIGANASDAGLMTTTLYNNVIANNAKVGVTTEIKSDDYASATTGGTVKVRLDGTTLYMTTDGTNP